METTTIKVKRLRELMQKQGIDLYVMENNDPHESEYLPDHWKEIEWLSGFRGEVATVLITQEDALLWTDSRFFISGEQQLASTPFKLMKMKVAGVPTAAEWIDEYKAQHDTNCTGGDCRILFGCEVDVNINLISMLWADRPALPMGKIELYPEELSGEKTRDRINRVLDAVEEQGGKGLWLSALDQIAWILNLRGSDIACTPVFISYLFLNRMGSILYVHEEKVTDEVRKYLANLHIDILPYEEAAQSDYREMVSPNPIPLMKGIKNPVEIEGFKSALLKDGIALTRFYHWLEDTLTNGKAFCNLCDDTSCPKRALSEMDIVQKLIDFRREQPRYAALRAFEGPRHSHHRRWPAPHRYRWPVSGWHHRHHPHHRHRQGESRNETRLYPGAQRTHPAGSGCLSTRHPWRPVGCTGSHRPVARRQDVSTWHIPRRRPLSGGSRRS